jgi:hypothetical protein
MIIKKRINRKNPACYQYTPEGLGLIHKVMAKRGVTLAEAINIIETKIKVKYETVMPAAKGMVTAR